jgi:quercetin dioxygenase-like cupin family protein
VNQEETMKTACVVAVVLALGGGLAGAEPGKPVALLDQVPYRDEGMGSRKIVDEKHVLMMQVALKPGQKVPEHKANSNVHIVVLKGAVVFTLAGANVAAKEGDLVPVAFGTPMQIRNDSQANATFLIVKTPNPSEMSMPAAK